jgi:hypothetical protein
VEFPKCGVCVDFHHEGGIYRSEWDLHQFREVSLVPGGGRPSKPCGRPTEWSGLHWLSPLTLASPPHVDMWQPSFRPNQLDACDGPMVLVVNEFPDVFPDELAGMPPDWDIEFMIELMLGTTPICKTPYRMATPEFIPMGSLDNFCPEEGWYSKVMCGLPCPKWGYSQDPVPAA